MELLCFVVPADTAPTTVGRYLRGRMKVSGSLVKRLKFSGGILINGAAVQGNHLLFPGDEVRLQMEPTGGAHIPPEPIPVVIAWEDEDLLVADKPAGLVVHPTRGCYSGTLANGLAHLYQQRGQGRAIHPIHRLDRQTSGLVVFAKHPLAHYRLVRQLRTDRWQRSYLALAWGHVEPATGRIDQPIGLVQGHPVAREVAVGGRASVTHYEVLAFGQGEHSCTLLRLRLETGRTHQIRVHLAHLGHPLLGDELYGPDYPKVLPRHALHAATLAFDHPRDGRRIELSSPLPADLAAELPRLGVPAMS